MGGGDHPDPLMIKLFGANEADGQKTEGQGDRQLLTMTGRLCRLCASFFLKVFIGFYQVLLGKHIEKSIRNNLEKYRQNYINIYNIYRTNIEKL